MDITEGWAAEVTPEEATRVVAAAIPAAGRRVSRGRAERRTESRR